MADLLVNGLVIDSLATFREGHFNVDVFEIFLELCRLALLKCCVLDIVDLVHLCDFGFTGYVGLTVLVFNYSGSLFDDFFVKLCGRDRLVFDQGHFGGRRVMLLSGEV